MSKSTYQITKQLYITSQEYTQLVKSTPLYNNFKWDSKMDLYRNTKINVYSIDCKYYEKEFNTLEELLDDIDDCLQDPNYEITRNGKGTGQSVIDLLGF